ncbi:MAG: hypothetical protein QOK29_5205, partial [Rhodospirillaceae bacterium]|nr:hypothetical protein [Rhodospirillaceae bacterium]
MRDVRAGLPVYWPFAPLWGRSRLVLGPATSPGSRFNRSVPKKDAIEVEGTVVEPLPNAM